MKTTITDLLEKIKLFNYLLLPNSTLSIRRTNTNHTDIFTEYKIKDIRVSDAKGIRELVIEIADK
jgi:hypothetical protein